MLVEKQGNFECMLATIAAVCDVRLQRVRNIACCWAGVAEWHETADAPDKFWPAVKATCDQLGHPNLYDLVCHPALDPPTSNTIGTDLNAKIDTLPAIGRGTVLACGGIWGTHIMPWENGYCYDPNHPDIPITLCALRDLGVRILRITQLGEDR